MIHYY